MPIPVPVELDQPGSGNGLLAQSRPLPDRWQRGISFLDSGCTQPVVMGECPSGDDLKPGQRSDSATFRPVSLILALECSSMDNNTDWAALADSELDRVRDHAMASELLTGAASLRDKGPSSDVNPALVNTATDLGTGATTLAVALGCLERATLAANAGRGATLFLTVEQVWQAAADYLIYRDGGRWRTPMGNLVIASEAFDGRAPVGSGSGAAPAPGATLYAYASTAVWAATGERSNLFDVDRSVNTTTARSEDIALAAFSPCATFAVETPVTACDLEG